MLQPFRLAQPQSLGLYSYFLCPRSLSVALLWILFSISSLRPHTWTRCSRCLMHAKQREGSLPWPAGHSLAKAAQCMVNLCCCKDKLLTRIQLVLHQHSSPNQLHQQSWKVLSSSLGDYILLPSVCRCCQTGGWRKGICRCFLCGTPFFFLFAFYLISVLCLESPALWHMLQNLNLFPASEGGRENNCVVGVSGEWDYHKLKHWTQNIPFSLGWGGGGLLVFSWSVSDRYRRCLGHNCEC